MNSLVVLLTLAASVASQETVQPPRKVEVTVYYEALCPDSLKFFNEQLTPHLDIVDKYVDLKHVPFGRATHEMVDGAWVSKCRHTPTECEGHAVQACAILHAPSESLRNAFISCLMKKGHKDRPYPTPECTNEVLVRSSFEAQQAFKRCIINEEYDQKLEEFKTETNSLQPPLPSVPTIVFNGVYSQRNQDLALTNFKKLLCEHLEADGVTVPECDGTPGPATGPATGPETHPHHQQHTGAGEPQQTVHVTVYYEALCPHSVKFFNEQLTPHLDLVDKFVQLEHVPFGKATHELVDGVWVSKCRHTNTECDFHAIQACVLLHTEAGSARNAFISCLMKRGDRNKPYPTLECAQKVQVPPHDGGLESINTCIETKEYDSQIERFKDKTKALQPPLANVPTIVFNGVFKQQDQDLALKNFPKVLCHYIQVNAKSVPECQAYSRGADSVISSLLLAAVAVLTIAHV